MNSTSGCAVKPTKKSIIRSFQSGNYRHLIITGKKQSGKTTLLKNLLVDIKAEGISTTVKIKKEVILKTSFSDTELIIGKYNPLLPGTSNKMEPVKDGFYKASQEVSKLLETNNEYIYIDEIGYLEKDETEYLNAIYTLLENKKCLLVLRKQELEHIRKIISRNDVMIVDLDDPYTNCGAVIMASGVSRRFNGLKLLAEYKDKKLIEHILDKTEGLFSKRLVVTRHQEILDIAHNHNIDCLLHELPYKSDTIRLGTEHFINNTDAIIFIPSDQPEIEIDTLMAYLILSKNNHDSIIRLRYRDSICSPGLFPERYYGELINLPQDKGGNIIARKYPNLYIETDNEVETMDIDTKDDLVKLVRISN